MEQVQCYKCKGEGANKTGFFKDIDEHCEVCGGLGFFSGDALYDHEHLINRLTMLRPQLIEAKMVGREITKPMELLAQAKKAVDTQEYRTAKELLDKAEQKLGFSANPSKNRIPKG